MPNIILTEYCNLKCPYCFAQTMINESTDFKNITLEQLDNILNWLLPTASQQDFNIGIIGGEPTLHPQFNEILNRINSFNSFTNSHTTIFTNGLTIENYIANIGLTTSLLINVNKLDTIKTKKLINNLKLVNSLHWFENNKVTLGCNLYLEEQDYSFFWEIIDLFSIPSVRMSVTAPNTNILKSNKELYYTSMKSIALDFINNAKKRNIKINYDCNQIPLCFFSLEEQNLITSLGTYTKFCEPVIDITPDFKATSCFGVYKTPISCNLFKNIDELIRFFQNEIFIRAVNNNTSLCKDCEKIKLLTCQGGCLSFSSLGNMV